MQFRNSTSYGQYSRSNFTQNLKKFFPLSAPVTRTRTRARFFKLTRLLYDSVHRFKIISVYFTFAYPLLKSYPYPVITLYVFGYEKCTEYGFCTRTPGWRPHLLPFVWDLALALLKQQQSDWFKKVIIKTKVVVYKTE